MSQARESSGRSATAFASCCAATSVLALDGRGLEIECFAPDVDTTDVESTAATRIAHSRGWKILLVVVVFVVAGGCVAAAILHTRPQGGGQVGDLVATVVVGGFLTLLDRDRLSPGRLDLDELLELILVVALVLLRLEIRRHLDLPRPDLRLPIQPLQDHRADLIRPQLRSWSSVAEYTLTGTFTRPKETSPFQMDRMG